jgi:hypothetical protein
MNQRQYSFASQFLPDTASEREVKAAQDRVFAELRRLDLTDNVAELDSYGYTVLAPRQVGPADFVSRLRSLVIDVAERRSGKKIDVATGAGPSAQKSPFGQVQLEPTLLGEDPLFEQALMNASALALITYLLGESCVLNNLSRLIKGPGPDYLPLHTDQNQSSGPAPFPAFAQVANATWALTDYTIGGGAICFVPGSHRWCRHPTPQEATDVGAYVPVEIPAGSIIIWHGNTWHGALPRTVPGVRLSLVMYFNRWYHTLFENLMARITPAMLARNPPRFAILTGAEKPWLQDPKSARAKATRTGLYA